MSLPPMSRRLLMVPSDSHRCTDPCAPVAVFWQHPLITVIALKWAHELETKDIRLMHASRQVQNTNNRSLTLNIFQAPPLIKISCATVFSLYCRNIPPVVHLPFDPWHD
jgi:hypothetical protein